VIDATGLAIAAGVSVQARVPNAAGGLEFRTAGTTISDPSSGFSFTGLFPGPFTITATSFFSPESAVVSGFLPDSNPVSQNVTLVLLKNTGSLSGCVLDPQGTQIAPVLDANGMPLPLSVFITSLRLRDALARDTQNPTPDGIHVDASTGCFISSIPLPPDSYTIQVTDDRLGSLTFGLTGQATAEVSQGTQARQDVRLLGLGTLAVEVVDARGQALPGVTVTVRRTTYSNEVREAMLSVPTSAFPLTVSGLTEGRWWLRRWSRRTPL
jgi:hypothetical protein